ncbi:MAG: DedA family protein [Candidatus Omnitrophica bacterium]|nr:DedA family protein [Candidatus Omnitrophota bacterium]
MLRDLYHWVLSWAESPHAIWALGAMSFAESSFFPIPPDVLLMALTLAQPSQGLWFAAVTTAASVLGGLFGYLIGLFGGRPLLRRWIGESRMQQIHDTFQRYEAWAILIAGFTPIPYKVFTIAAGVFYVNPRVFVVASLISRGARFFLVAGTIQLFGPWMKAFIERYFDVLSVAFFVLLVGGFLMIRRRRHAG